MYGLKELAYTAAGLHAEEAIEPLIQLAEVRLQDPEAAVMALSVFKTNKIVQDGLFKVWIYQERFEKYVAMIMNVLSSVEPQNYPQYLKRFFEVKEKHTHYFQEEPVLRELVRVVGVENINARLLQLPAEQRVKLSSFTN
ncbi:MAG TPA: hypothetical protein VIK81_01065 [Patescibacteria group bacterium]